MTDVATTPSESSRELVSFRAGDQEFCVDIMAVREIRGWTPSTTLPQTPSYVCGVINLRGAVLPIVDFNCRLGREPAVPSDRHVIIVTHIGARLVGLLVDAVSDILTVTGDVIQPTPDVACDTVRNFVRGILAVDGRMISLVALDRILPDLEAEAA
ncbi:chemotaxis protein CheW [Caulobacter sp. NIBR1757]|uniref:chemotaxis protein CheW n=1 Tax=Caulobacter sp. NIBR1757 TaxID=3016000 RepID=UPI0022F0378E|nr:chemotaxis protein CheW [Caulobacter sp. NIBR1757]WGM38331.1 Chemotaxis protein CheW [Caulobacter sp. NIBR1757]